MSLRSVVEGTTSPSSRLLGEDGHVCVSLLLDVVPLLVFLFSEMKRKSFCVFLEKIPKTSCSETINERTSEHA
jgi:hypothetical protein